MKTQKKLDSKINSITPGRWTAYMAATAMTSFAALVLVWRPKFVATLLPVLFLLITLQSGHAQHGSATWSSNPGDGNLWGSLVNWVPEVIPNGPDDTATFANSSTTFVDFDIFNDGTITLDGIHFAAGGDAFTIADFSATMIFDGAGVINDSGLTQSFITTGAAGQSTYSFNGTSTAGILTSYTMQGGSPGNSGFYGILLFNEQSSAGSSSVNLQGGTGTNRFGGETLCSSSATLDQASFTINGGTSSGKGGLLSLANSSGAAQSNLTANGGSSGGAGGVILFKDDSLGGTARVLVSGNGSLDISPRNAPGITTGSLEGDGLVFLGGRNLTVGSNDLSTSFSGVIQDGGSAGGTGGSLTKIGPSTFTLSNANSYTGGTIISQGTLTLSSPSGSATGTGPVQVLGGTLAGSGTIAGAVTIGGDNTKIAVLSPANKHQATLTIQGSLTFLSSTYTCTYRGDSRRVQFDQVTANGVTINDGSGFNFPGKTRGNLQIGTALTVINNTAATPISGTFSNLADGAVFSANGGNFQANYEGGDGNDLTLTVVP